MKTRTKLLVTAAAAFAVAPLAGAQAPAPAPPGGPEQRPGWQMPGGHQDGMRMRQGGGPGMGRGMGMDCGMGMRRGMGRGGGMRAGRQMPLGMIARNPAMRERLGLTAEQVNKIRTQSSVFSAQSIRGRADLQVKRMELADLTGADNPDRAAIDRKLREVTEAQFAAERSSIEHRLAMRDVLTPEQRTRLEEMRREQFNRRMGPGFGQEGPAGPGFRPSGPRPQGEQPAPPPGQRPPNADEQGRQVDRVH